MWLWRRSALRREAMHDERVVRAPRRGEATARPTPMGGRRYGWQWEAGRIGTKAKKNYPEYGNPIFRTEMGRGGAKDAASTDDHGYVSFSSSILFVKNEGRRR